MDKQRIKSHTALLLASSFFLLAACTKKKKLTINNWPLFFHLCHMQNAVSVRVQGDAARHVYTAKI